MGAPFIAVISARSSGWGIDVLLEEKKSGSDGTQLSFINDMGEILHWGYVGL